MTLEDQKRWIIFVVAARGTFKFLTKIAKLMPASYLFPFISACWEGNEISLEVILISLWTQTDFGRIFKNYSGLWAFWWCKQNANWTTLSYSSNCFIFSAEKLETTRTTKKQQNLKNGKVRFRLKGNGRLKAECHRSS